jgi:3'-phosphoadenosine 5'-phosphosulfate sulfotransferase (PAPS reductase)/FAD synthetase
MNDKVSQILAIDDEEQQREELIAWITSQANKVRVLIAFSGGKDSVAMVLHLLRAGVKKEQIELWHHEVDGDGEKLFDWPCTRSYCQAFADAFSLPLLFSYAGGGILREMYRNNETIQPVYFQKEPGGEYFRVDPQDQQRFYNTRRRFPAVSADLNVRWCSWIAKISVMLKGINHSERYRDSNLVICTGERRLESTARSNYREMELYRGASNTRRAIQWRPIIDKSEEQVWGIIKEERVQPHPCYELGWNRCSCQLCIFSDADTWASLQEIVPKKVKRISEIEQDLQFTLYADKEKGRNVMKDVYKARVERGTSFVEEGARKRWLDEALGEFESPVIVDKWHLPAGAFKMETAGAN